MTILLNVGRLLMLMWIVYGLLLIFAPHFIHQAPNEKSGIIQIVVAYTLGYLMDRALGVVRRRRAALAVEAAIDTDAKETNSGAEI